MMEVVIVDDGNRLTVYELVERVIPCENHLDIPERRNDQLFTNPQGKKLTRSGVSYVLAKYSHKANTAVGSFFPQITPHCLRHSKAMHLVGRAYRRTN